jgi:hypothetical protein
LASFLIKSEIKPLFQIKLKEEENVKHAQISKQRIEFYSPGKASKDTGGIV